MKEKILNKAEKIVTNEEIAHYEQLLLLPHCFNPFPHTTILQQTNLVNVFCKKIEK